MEATFFSKLAQEFSERAARASVSHLNPSSTALRKHLLETLSARNGVGSSFLAPPVFESLFEWERCQESFADLKIHGKSLESELIQAMSEPPERLAKEAFPKDRKPYLHQLEAWQALLASDPKSVIVSTGTGSGKSECYMVPILNDLIRDSRESGKSELVGVRALFLYPLNALINSQRERLEAWTDKLGKRVRFCLYNSQTAHNEHQVPEHKRLASKSRVFTRKELRSSPPPILVTNATMLEYMLVRKEDAPIVAQSKGKLRWIVLDEAHNYVGSAAAEISLLLRRVMHAFEVDAKSVRFIASSATISGDEAKNSLRSYLANLAGVDDTQVVLVDRPRVLPELPTELAEKNQPWPSLEELTALPEDELFRRLAANADLRKLRKEVSERACDLNDFSDILFSERNPTPHHLDEILLKLDAASRAKIDNQALLPLRAHYFHRTQPGLWACVNSKCSGRNGSSLNSDEWRFGAVFFQRRHSCSHCQYQVLDLLSCRLCGASYLSGRRADDGQRSMLTPLSWGFGSDEVENYDDEIDDGSRKRSGANDDFLLFNGPQPEDDLAEKACAYSLTVDENGQIDLPGESAIEHTAIPSHEGRYCCLSCGVNKPDAKDQFRQAMLGARFFLSVSIPTLLEHMPPAEDCKPDERPFAGRSLITFTDSRQGSASFSSRLQFENERNFIRSLLYHEVQKDSDGLSWKEAAEKLHERKELDWIRERQKFEYRGANLEVEELASLALFRELLRRPMRQNSVESLGLVKLQYPKLSKIKQVPILWADKSGSIEEWRDFLTVLLDFFVRAHSAVKFPKALRRWMGLAVSPSLLVAQGEEGVRNKKYAWPAFNKNHRARSVRVLEAAFDLNLQAKADQDWVTAVLAEAWKILHDVGILSRSDEGSLVDLEKSASLHAVEEGWLCPVTHRVLATTLRGLSPYQLDGHRAPVVCQKIQMPKLPFPFLSVGGSSVSQEVISTWLGSEEVEKLRQIGLWTEFCDRIASLSPYIQASEHSAQLTSHNLELIEQRFKERWLNVLSCSTTMEMGIDIGGLSAVAMNNAPPGPANFRQRSGRAGRRQESRATSLTLCQSSPHAEAIFANPTWPFTSPIHVPKVSLESEIIVQRHVQALALSHYLYTKTDDPKKLNAGWFFKPVVDKGDSISEHCETWLRGEASTNPKLVAGIQSLLVGTVLQGRDLVEILEQAAEKLQSIRLPWMKEFDALHSMRERTEGWEPELESKWKEMSAAQRAMTSQLRRLTGEYLLTTLASSGFLPAHGFPLNVLPFVNTTAELLKHEEEDTEDGSDSPWSRRHRDYPSRPLPIAIQEYAPGQSVVIHGAVYKSSGVTLNWHIPPGDHVVNEDQLLPRYRRCDVCGTIESGTMTSKACSHCKEASKIHIVQVLTPSGFAVDISSRPHNDVSVIEQGPRMEPWITTKGAGWQPLLGGQAGDLRFSEQGQIVYIQDNYGHGYCLCLTCGRVQAEKGRPPKGQPDNPPNKWEEHRPLRGRARDQKSESDSPICPGAQHPKRRIGFGGESITSVLELQLRDVLSGVPITDKTQLTSIAVALRQAIVRRLGIDERELGFAVTYSPSKDGDEKRLSIFIYDNADGGAGYSSALVNEIPELLADARKVLDCDCGRACHKCLLTFDTQFHFDFLDNIKAREALNDGFLAAMKVEEKDKLFPGDNQRELLSLLQRLERELRRPGVKSCILSFNDDVENWNLDSSLFWDMCKRHGHLLTLQLPENINSKFTSEESHSFASRCLAYGLTLRKLKDNEMKIGKGWHAASLDRGAEQILWAVPDRSVLKFGDEWGLKEGLAIIRHPGTSLSWSLRGTVTDPKELIQPSNTDYKRIEVGKELDGDMATFADRFWGLIGQKSKAFEGLLQSETLLSAIQITDRYVKCPLTALFWTSVVGALSKRSKLEPNLQVGLKTLAPHGGMPKGPHVESDWGDSKIQVCVLKELFKRAGLPQAQVHIAGPKERLPHRRELLLTWSDGLEMTICPDQGFGFMRSRFGHFDFKATCEEQANLLLTRKFEVRNGEPNDEFSAIYFNGPGQG